MYNTDPVGGRRGTDFGKNGHTMMKLLEPTLDLLVLSGSRFVHVELSSNLP